MNIARQCIQMTRVQNAAFIMGHAANGFRPHGDFQAMHLEQF